VNIARPESVSVLNVKFAKPYFQIERRKY